MTPEETKAERVKARASSCYNALYEAQRLDRYIRGIVAKHGENPAFKDYMRGMGLTDDLARFIAREPLDSAERTPGQQIDDDESPPQKDVEG